MNPNGEIKIHRWRPSETPPPPTTPKTHTHTHNASSSRRCCCTVPALGRGNRGDRLGSGPDRAPQKFFRHVHIYYRASAIQPTLINNLQEAQTNVSSTYGMIIQEIRAGMGKFAAAELVHENRRSNVDAHRLARSSLYSPIGRQIWFTNPPIGVCTQYPE